MADVTITYKGETLATMDTTSSKVLDTQGQYCEDDIRVAYVKPSSGTPAITIVDTPDSHGGVEREITALNISDSTLETADQLAQGITGYNKNGVKLTGTASGGGNQVFLTQYTLNGDTTISDFLRAVEYAVHSTSCIILIRVKGSVAPTSGAYTLNNYWYIFQSGVRSDGRHYYKQGQQSPDLFAGILFTNEGDTVVNITNGVLTSTFSGTSCLGSTGDIATIVEIDVDDDFIDTLLT